jgi:hypothetical protein
MPDIFLIGLAYTLAFQPCRFKMRLMKCISLSQPLPAVGEATSEAKLDPAKTMRRSTEGSFNRNLQGSVIEGFHSLDWSAKDAGFGGIYQL